MKAFLIAGLALGLMPLAATAQEEKAEIQVMNNRNEAITMRFSYAFRDYKWMLMEKQVPTDTDITYRFPVNIPGCEKLHAWGIADGVLAITSATGALCERRVSLCDKSVSIMRVSNTECAWRQAR